MDEEVLAANESVVTSSEKFKDNEAAAADFTRGSGALSAPRRPAAYRQCLVVATFNGSGSQRL